VGITPPAGWPTRSQQAGAHTPFLARPVALAGLLEDATAETAAPAG